MPDLIDFLPVSSDNTVDKIRARVDSDANAGVDPASANFIDTTPGGFWYDITQALILEVARLRDLAAVEIPAAMFPGYAWGDYLDEHADALGLERKAATKANGVVRFTGTDGGLIASGTEVSTAPVSDDDDPVSFVTLEEGTISGGFVDLPVEAVSEGAAGNLGANTITEPVSPNAAVSAVGNPAAMTGGSDVETDEELRYRVLLKLRGGSGAGTIADYEQWGLAYEGVESVVVEPLWNGAGTVRVVCTAEGQGPVSDTVKYGLQDQLDPPGFVTQSTATETLPLSSATVEVVTTAGRPTSGSFRLGTTEVTYTGLTPTSFTGCDSSGSGSVASGTRVSADFGKGYGLAPIGAVVTVDTVTTVPVDVDATVAHFTGYNLDGSAGNVSTEADIVAALERYINTLKPGDDVVLNHVVAQFFRVEGVQDVSAVELDGSAATVTITGLQVAKLGTVTLT